MELDARRRICVAFDGLDDSIWRTGGDAETRGESLDALVMVAVHGQRRAADRGREAGTAFYRHRMRRGIHRVRRQQTRRCRDAERHDRADHIFYVDIIP
jgi:hypothetical protein